MRKDQVSRRLFLRGLAAGTAVVGISQPAQADIWGDFLGTILKTPTDFGKDKSKGTLTEAEAAGGLKEALRIAAGRAINQVGKQDGYFRDDLIRIPLPKSLAQIQDTMKQVGLSGMLDDLELRLNRAAEKAAPFAKSLIRDSINSMTISDAIGIVKGGDTSATDYFRDRMTPPLTSAFHPIVETELSNAGAMKVFDSFASSYSNIPFVPALDKRAKDDLIDHGVEKALYGLFFYLGKEEAAIRRDPAKRTTELLKHVFG